VRILFAVSSLGSGGAERVIVEIASALARAEQSVGVLTLSGAEGDHYALPPGTERIALDLLGESASLVEGLIANQERIRQIRRRALEFRPDVVVSFVEQMNVKVLAALAWAAVPVIVSERIDPRRHRVGSMWTLARRLLYPRAARVVVQTESVAHWARGFIRTDRVRVIPNFVRDLPGAPAWEERATTELLAVGRLDEQKGFDVLLRAFAASGLAAHGSRLTILGEGPQRPVLERLAADLGLAEAVSMPGVVKEPERWMARCAVFVLSSRYEGFPNVLLEAMAMGCAVIATDCDSGPREIVDDGVNGVLVPPEDPDALAAALVRLMHDAELRRDLGDRASDVRQRFAKPAILQQWEGLIREVVMDGKREAR